MADIWRCKAYIEYEIEADSEAEANQRFGECILRDMDEGADIRDIAEVGIEKIKPTRTTETV